MKAIIQARYGPPDEVLQLEDMAQPVPGDDEVLVRVRATSVHADIWHVVTGRPSVLRLMGAGVAKPKHPVPGTDLAGQVESVGRNVTRFRPGDEVFGESIKGTQWTNGGAYAEFACAPQDALAPKPQGVSFEQAAAVPTSGLIALNNLRHLKTLPPGSTVLINGAGGGVGSMAVQLAKAYEAVVTGVDRPEKREMIRALGADHVIDYTQEDCTRRGERYDLILDVASTLSFTDSKRALTPNGIYVIIGHDHYGSAGGRTLGSLPHFFKLVARSPFDRHLSGMLAAPGSRREAMAELAELLAAGKLTPVIDRTYPLGEVPAAIRHLQSGNTRGKIIITP